MASARPLAAPSSLSASVSAFTAFLKIASGGEESVGVRLMIVGLVVERSRERGGRARRGGDRGRERGRVRGEGQGEGGGLGKEQIRGIRNEARAYLTLLECDCTVFARCLRTL